MPRYVGGESSNQRSNLPDSQILKGVNFDVRFIGCLEVKTSMKTLDFTTRSQVSKECISRVCEAAGLKTSSKRRVDKKILQSISDKPVMEMAGTNVSLTVSSKFLSLVNIETGKTIARHDMPKISFASGGDTDTLDFVAYVAKDLDDSRMCYVLECGGGKSGELITTIARAFGLRYNEFFGTSEQNIPSDKDYYNDLPGKAPPLNDISVKVCKLPYNLAQLNIKTSRERTSSNLIDLNSPLAEHNYVNDKYTDANSNNTSVINDDVFDIQPTSLSAEIQRTQLITETWYHGAISRQTAESLIKNDGDFLVRESQGTQGQYVLTGMQDVTPKHLLLMDPQGYVRTKDRLFESVSHLINYHWANLLPIVSAESSLVLRNPIFRSKIGQTG